MLFAILALHAALQDPASQRRPTVVRDSTPSDSARRDAPMRLPVTAAVLASAFEDVGARELFERARRTRMAQDSSLTSYDATVRQRMSVRVAVGKIGRERLVYRQESATRVQWQRNAGARMEVTGGRVSIPIASKKNEREALQDLATSNEISTIPYFPGSETLWIGGLSARTEVNDRSVVNPLAKGAEAYYTFASGDSISYRLPDGRSLRLRELKVRPRAAKSNLAVGSLWFDTESGHLVRAAYRMAAPTTMDVGVSSEDSTAMAPKIASFILAGLLAPNTAQISAIVVEYGLYAGRFWLPRAQSMEGSVQAMFAHVPVKFENAFGYASVNQPLGLAEVHVDTSVRERPPYPGEPPEELDSAARATWRDSTRRTYRAARKAREDSIKAGHRVGSMRQCETSDMRVVRKYRTEAKIPVEIVIPCDLDKLIASLDLPASAYDAGEEIFGSGDADQLIAGALSMAAQAPLFELLPRPRYRFGPSMTRYNRVEGLSTGLLVEQQLGAGYVATTSARFGFADRMPNVELALARTNLSFTIRLNGYRRLVFANDWGNPLSFGSSFSAFFFGRDKGFYYRATGAELLWTTERGARLDWRAFTERQSTADQKTSYSVSGSFIPNIVMPKMTSTGGAARFQHSYGLNPRGFIAFTDLRVEAAGGDSTYGRGALDLTLARGLPGEVTAALTLAGGSSMGRLPTHRRWFLGGTHTVRGQSADTALSGNAFLLGRGELARAHTPAFRSSLFGDVGWIGDRTAFTDVGRPMSGVGAGVSVMDGLLRFDVARGLYPRKQTRVDLYLNARF